MNHRDEMRRLINLVESASNVKKHLHEANEPHPLASPEETLNLHNLLFRKEAGMEGMNWKEPRPKETWETYFESLSTNQIIEIGQAASMMANRYIGKGPATDYYQALMELVIQKERERKTKQVKFSSNLRK